MPLDIERERARKRETVRRWRLRHPEVHRERVRAYYKKTAEERRAYAKAWRKRRPDLVKIHTARRTAKRRAERRAAQRKAAR